MTKIKAPTPEEVEAARKIVADADAAVAAAQQAEREQAAAAHEARLERLRAVVESPAYAEVQAAVVAVAPEFAAEGNAHVPYLVTALRQVAALVPPRGA